MDGFSIVIHTRADQWNSKIGDTFSLHEQEVPNFLLGLFVRPAGRTYLEVEVLYTPDRGKC